MKLEILRYASNPNSTGGVLSVDGKFFCYTCEDEKRDVKVDGETRIPNGNYQITLRNEGGMTKRYAKKYDFHRGMLWIRDVLNFKWVYLHVGNDEEDTAGCPLVGYGANRVKGESTVSRSVEAYTDLYKLIIAAMDRGEEILISIWALEL